MLQGVQVQNTTHMVWHESPTPNFTH